MRERGSAYLLSHKVCKSCLILSEKRVFSNTIYRSNCPKAGHPLGYNAHCPKACMSLFMNSRQQKFVGHGTSSQEDLLHLLKAHGHSQDSCFENALPSVLTVASFLLASVQRAEDNGDRHKVPRNDAWSMRALSPIAVTETHRMTAGKEASCTNPSYLVRIGQKRVKNTAMSTK